MPRDVVLAKWSVFSPSIPDNPSLNPTETKCFWDKWFEKNKYKQKRVNE